MWVYLPGLVAHLKSLVKLHDQIQHRLHRCVTDRTKPRLGCMGGTFWKIGSSFATESCNRTAFPYKVVCNGGLV